MGRGRIRKYSRRTLKGFAYLTGGVLVLVLVFLASLDTAFVRARVRQLVHLPIDWKHTRLSLTRGLILEGFSIENGASFRSVAPHFVEVDRIEVSWSFDRLFRDDALAERIAISGVRVAFVVDQSGQTSLSALRSGPPAPPESPPEHPTPISQTLEALGKRLPVGKLTVHDTRVRIILLGPDKPREAEATVDADVRLPKRNEVEGQLGVNVVKQTILAGIPPITDLLSLDARASFRPNEHRVLIMVPKLHGLDGALAADAILELPDEGAPLLDRVVLALDSRPIQKTLDHEDSPLHLAGTVKILAEQIRLAQTPTVGPTGKLDVDAKLARLALRTPGQKAEGEHIVVDLALRTPPGHAATTPAFPLGQAKLGLRIGRFSFLQGNFALGISDGDLDLGIEGLDPYARQPFELARKVQSHGKVGRLEVRPGQILLLAEGTTLDTTATFPSMEPGTLKIDAPVRAFSVTFAEKPILKGEPAHLRIDLEKARLDMNDLLASEGEEHSEVSAGPFSLKSHLTKHKDDAVAFELDARARHLGPVASVVPMPKGMSVPWGEVSAHAQTAGKITGLRRVASIQIDERSQLELDRPALRGGPMPTHARRMTLQLSSRGSLVRHAGDATLKSEGLVLGEAEVGAPTLTAKLAMDRSRPKLTVVLGLSGGEAPTLGIDAALDFQRPRRVLDVDLHVAASELGLLGRLLPKAITERHQLAWSKLGLKLDGKLGLRGVVTDFSDFAPRVARDPIESARGDAKLDLAVSGLDYKDKEGALAVALDKLSAGLVFRGADGDVQDHRPRRDLKLELDVEHAQAKQGEHAIALELLHPSFSAEARGPVRAPEVVAALDVKLAKLAQDYYPTYPVGQLALGATVRGDTRGILRVERFDLDNPAAGSKVALKGGVDLVSPLRDPRSAAEILLSEAHDERATQAKDTPRRLPGRVGIDAELELAQRLDTFPLAKNITAGGVVTLPLHVQSADLALFSLRGTLGLQHVKVHIPGERPEAPVLHAENVQGKVPFHVEVIVDRKRKKDGEIDTKLRFVPHPEGVSFPRPQFAEHQPFLSQRSFFAADKVKLNTFAVGPLAGNLAIDHTRLELSQLEMHAAGGRVRGQLIAAIAGEDSKILFRGDVTGLMPPKAKKRDDRLDANLALVIEPMRLTIQGRTELVHISRALLLSLMDVWDPYHEEVAANRVRLGLKLGYPEQVRMGFDQGFASMSIKLGGVVSSLVRIDEIKNVAVGPLLEKYLGPVVRPLVSSLGTQSPPKEQRP